MVCRPSSKDNNQDMTCSPDKSFLHIPAIACTIQNPVICWHVEFILTSLVCRSYFLRLDTHHLGAVAGECAAAADTCIHVHLLHIYAVLFSSPCNWPDTASVLFVLAGVTGKKAAEFPVSIHPSIHYRGHIKYLMVVGCPSWPVVTTFVCASLACNNASNPHVHSGLLQT